ncbi:type IIL restriction-modification enzyme MmeI, partial [Klebsiella pneumoniae]
YWTAQINPPSVICGDANMLVSDPDGLQFGFISSSMFISGQRTVGGRIKSDYRFSSTLTWNTFPVPELDEATQKRIIKAGQKVLDARALHPD